MPGCQGRQGGPTKGCWNITALKDNALPGQLVQVGGLDMGMAHKTIIGPCLVIGNDVNDIGFLGSLHRASQQETKGDDEFIHFGFSFLREIGAC